MTQVTPVLVQRYLLTHSLKQLAAEHGVYAGIAKGARYKASFNYDQIEAKESDPLARQCRGLVLARVMPETGAFCENLPCDYLPDSDDPVGPTQVLARPFDRFFNHGQHGTDAALLLGRPGTRVFEKLDGTLCIVYRDHFKKAWCVATRSVPEADCPIDGFGEHTFRTLFEHALRQMLNLGFDQLTAAFTPGLTYLFELTSPQNRVVVEYDRPSLHLLGLRDTYGVELCPVEQLAPGFPVPHAPYHDVGTFGELIGLVTARSPKTSEGLVVRGADFARVKVKNPAWVALSALRGSVANSPRRLMEVVLLGQEDDVLPMLTPQVRALGASFKRRFAEMCRRSDDEYQGIYERTDGNPNQRKDIALWCQAEKKWIPFFMDRFTDKSSSFADFVAQRRDVTGSWPDSFIDNLIHNLPPDVAEDGSVAQ